MEAIYKRHLNQSYMILKAGDSLREFHELEILSYNCVPGLLESETTVSDGQLQFWYDITGKQTLADYLSRRQVDGQLLGQLIEALGEVCSRLEDYLLEEAGLLLSPDYLYLDFDRRHIKFVYLPGAKEDIQAAFQALMEKILQKLDHGDKWAVTVAYELYQLSLQGVGPLYAMLEKTLGQDADHEDETERETVSVAREYIPMQKQEPEEIVDKIKSKISWNPNRLKERLGLRAVRREVPMSAEPFQGIVRKVPEEVWHPTEILHIDQGLQGILMYQGKKDLPDIEIDRPVFLIGKKEKDVDACINIKCISRIHAKVEMEQGDYYIEDMNSTNGTYLNGERLEYRQKAKLEARDRIAFGLVEYVFL